MMRLVLKEARVVSKLYEWRAEGIQVQEREGGMKCLDGIRHGAANRGLLKNG